IYLSGILGEVQSGLGNLGAFGHLLRNTFGKVPRQKSSGHEWCENVVRESEDSRKTSRQGVEELINIVGESVAYGLNSLGREYQSIERGKDGFFGIKQTDLVGSQAKTGGQEINLSVDLRNQIGVLRRGLANFRLSIDQVPHGGLQLTFGATFTPSRG